MAKRNITAEDGSSLRSPAPPRAQERELDRVVSYMLDQITKRFRNGALLSMRKTTQNKFTDANYATEYLKQAARITRKLIRQFPDKRIEALVKTVLNKANKRNRSVLYSLVEKRIGIPTTELTNTEGLKADINALILETAQWVKKLRDDTLELYTANSLRAMTQGSSLADVLSQFDGLAEKRRNHARFTARNQIANFNSITTKLRAQNLGITEAVWLTSRDERVRDSHQSRNGKRFVLSEGLYSSKDGLHLLPGTDYQCRCTYELIIPEDDDG